MRLAVWSPNALTADALGVLLDRESDIQVIAAGGADVESISSTLVDTPGLVTIGVPLDDCRRLFSGLGGDRRSSTVALSLVATPDHVFESWARRLGFADVIDTSRPSESIVAAIRVGCERGSSIASGANWDFDDDTPLETLFCPHCRDQRDVDILHHIVDGHTDTRIAELLSLNAQTVRNRVSNMLLESGLANRTQLAIDFYRTMLALRGVDSSRIP